VNIIAQAVKKGEEGRMVVMLNEDALYGDERVNLLRNSDYGAISRLARASVKFGTPGRIELPEEYARKLVRMGPKGWENFKARVSLLGIAAWTDEGLVLADWLFVVEAPAALVDQDNGNAHNGNGHQPRRRYPSDERRKTEPLHTPQDSAENSATGSVGVSAESPRAGARDPEPESGTGNRNPEPVIYKNSGIRNPEPEPEPEASPPKLRHAPPVTMVERLVELGMERRKAEERVKEKGEQIWQDAIESMPYSKKPIDDPLAWIIAFVFKEGKLPSALVRIREEQRKEREQQAMPMVGAVPGGKAPGAPTSPPQPTIKEKLMGTGTSPLESAEYSAVMEKLGRHPQPEGENAHGTG
jgi:hypothetical protein